MEHINERLTQIVEEQQELDAECVKMNSEMASMMEMMKKNTPLSLYFAIILAILHRAAVCKKMTLFHNARYLDQRSTSSAPYQRI